MERNNFLKPKAKNAISQSAVFAVRFPVDSNKCVISLIQTRLNTRPYDVN